jgi:quinol monooxygenase YgiN
LRYLQINAIFRKASFVNQFTFFEERVGYFCYPLSGLILVSVFLTHSTNNIMEKFALLARLEAKPGKEQEVADFIKSALPLAQAETETLRWYALQIGPSTFGIFDTFTDETGRNAHLGGEIAKALMAKAPELLATSPAIEKVDLLAIK